VFRAISKELRDLPLTFCFATVLYPSPGEAAYSTRSTLTVFLED
jgi:hypothetical protein